MSIYHIGHVVRDQFPFLWNALGKCNSAAFNIKYGKRLKKGLDENKFVHKQVIKDGKERTLSLTALDEKNAQSLADFFSRQPQSSFDFFKPHDFDTQTLKDLAKDNSFLAFTAIDDSSRQVVGYVFMRSFWWGKCYRGYITDYQWRGLGVNKWMNNFATSIATSLGMRTFGTISPKNIASLKSAEAVNDIHIIKTLENGDYFLEYLPKTENHESNI